MKTNGDMDPYRFCHVFQKKKQWHVTLEVPPVQGFERLDVIVQTMLIVLQNNDFTCGGTDWV